MSKQQKSYRLAEDRGLSLRLYFRELLLALIVSTILSAFIVVYKQMGRVEVMDSIAYFVFLYLLLMATFVLRRRIKRAE